MCKAYATLEFYCISAASNINGKLSTKTLLKFILFD